MYTAAEFTEMFLELIETEGFGAEEFEVDRIRDTRLLSSDEGFVVRFASGNEFQLTVMQSGYSPEPEPAAESPYDFPSRFTVLTRGRS